MGTEDSGMPCIQVPRKGVQSEDARRILHVLALEVKGDDHKGGTITTSTILSVWGAHTIGASYETQMDC